MPQSVLISSGFISLFFAVFLAPCVGAKILLRSMESWSPWSPAAKDVVVSHRPIAKLMPAMTMPFRRKIPPNSAACMPDRACNSSSSSKTDISLARHIRVTGESDLDIPAPKDRKQIGELIPDFTLNDQDARRPVRLVGFHGKVVARRFRLYPLPPARCLSSPICQFCLFATALSFPPIGNDLILLSITIDPQFDTPAVLNEYAHRWAAQPARWQFLTGDRIRKSQSVAGNFGLVYWPDEGSLGHNSTTSIIGRDGRVAAIVEGSSFRVDQLGDLIARQLEGLQNEDSNYFFAFWPSGRLRPGRRTAPKAADACSPPPGAIAPVAARQTPHGAGNRPLRHHHHQSGGAEILRSGRRADAFLLGSRSGAVVPAGGQTRPRSAHAAVGHRDGGRPATGVPGSSLIPASSAFGATKRPGHKDARARSRRKKRWN